MTVLANLIIQGVGDGKNYLEGKTLTRPALLYTDGIEVTYGVDVDIGREGVINENGDIGMLPLYSVPIAAGNRSLIYADIGTPVTLSKNAVGQWQVVGFAKTYPATLTVRCVTLPQYCLRIPTEHPPGPPIVHPIIIGEERVFGSELRPLTYGELGIYGIYGEIPYGAIGEFQGDVLIAIRDPNTGEMIGGIIVVDEPPPADPDPDQPPIEPVDPGEDPDVDRYIIDYMEDAYA